MKKLKRTLRHFDPVETSQSFVCKTLEMSAADRSGHRSCPCSLLQNTGGECGGQKCLPNNKCATASRTVAHRRSVGLVGCTASIAVAKKRFFPNEASYWAVSDNETRELNIKGRAGPEAAAAGAALREGHGAERGSVELVFHVFIAKAR